MGIAPQSDTGEVDFIERCGTSIGNGMATNFGAGAGADQATFPIPGDVSQPAVYYYKFNSPDHGHDDSVEGWKCPLASNPIEHGTSTCVLIGKNHGYYKRTYHEVNDANIFVLVTDIWNTPTSQAGACTPSSSSFQNRRCKYTVKDIQLSFYRPPSWSTNPPCNILLARKFNNVSMVV